MITVECPHCERKVVGSDKFSGQYRECPNCGELFVALSSKPDAQADSDGERTEASDQICLPARSSRPAEGQQRPRSPGSQERSDHELSDSELPALDGEFSPVPGLHAADPLPQIELTSPDAESDDEDACPAPVWKQTLQSKETRGYLVSTAVHAVLLLIFAAWILPQLPATDFAEITAELSDTLEDNTVETVDFSFEPQNDTDDPVTPPLIAAVNPAIQSSVFDASDAANLTTIAAKQDDSDKGQATTGPGSPASDTEPREASVSQARSVEGATDAIIDSIKSRLLTGDTVVMWLMDRSVSMQRQRNMLADRLEGYLQSVHANRTDDAHTLTHIVVAFGSGPEKLATTTEPRKALAAIRKDYGLDATGQENVFSTIEWCEQQFVRKNSRNRSKHLMCVVCTDESGDDYLRLERTIKVCRDSRMAVSVIGPSAVLGQMQGYHGFQAEDNRLYYLPVVRGPDTALRQRVRLPYWFRNVPSNWDESRRGPWYGNTPAWQGGSNLDAMLSGFGPYALTRLTMATRGNYILYDRPSDSSPFQIETLRPYLPDYRSADQIQSDLRERPLRMAILKAVDASHQRNLQSPRLDYGVQFGGSFYLSPQQFKARLGTELAAQKRQAESAVRAIDQMIELFENRVVDGQYEQETSPRWKAWHDLTYGRLLASRIRYQAFADFAPTIRGGTLKSSTNGLAIRPGALSSRVEETTRAEDARRLLNRCITSNPNTPWFYLARRELAHAFGFTVRERTVPLATRSGGGPTRRTQVSLPRL